MRQHYEPGGGIPFLLLAGLPQGMGHIPMATLLIRDCGPKFRGRIMGIRKLTIYGNVPGQQIAGRLIPSIGYPLTITLNGVVAIGLVVVAPRGGVGSFRRGRHRRIRGDVRWLSTGVAYSV